MTDDATPERPPICRGQVWEIHALLKTTNATVLGPPILSRGQVFVPMARDELAPTLERLDMLIELRAVPGGPTLEHARELRADPEAIEPSRLYAMAQREVAESHAVGAKDADHVTADLLYRHALYEAGAIVREGSAEPFEPCPICGYRAGGGTPVASEPNPARWLPEDPSGGE